MRSGWLRSAAGLAALSTVAVGGAQSGLYYSYFKEKRALTLDSRYVSIYRDPSAGLATLTGRMASEGDLRKAAVAGWYFIDVQGGATPETVSALESQTNGSVMPVFRDRYGYPLVFSPVINIRFESGVGGDEVGSILGRFAPASIKPDGWIPGLYRVELKEKNGYRTEFQYGSFVRVLPLTVDMSKEDVKATYRDGILEIRVPVGQGKAEGRKVPVTRV